jgi:hypothetical protein
MSETNYKPNLDPTITMIAGAMLIIFGIVFLIFLKRDLDNTTLENTLFYLSVFSFVCIPLAPLFISANDNAHYFKYVKIISGILLAVILAFYIVLIKKMKTKPSNKTISFGILFMLSTLVAIYGL